MKIIYIAFFSLLCSGLIAQYPNPNDFNTANNGSGGQLPYLEDDLNWEVALGPSGTTTLPTDLTYVPATVSGGCAPGNWYDPANDVVNGTVFTNSTWISYDFGNSDPCDQTGNQIDLFYKIEFDLPATGPCGSPIANGFCYAMDFLADNSVYQIYVNGVDQGFDPPSSIYSFAGFSYGNRREAELCSDWLEGPNELVVHIKSGGCCSGFLSKAKFPELPADSGTAICLSRESIDVTLEAPDFEVILTPEDIDLGSYSPCNDLEMTIVNNVFSCDDIGENISELVLGFGDSANSCQTTVNVMEGDQPCPDDPCNDLSASLIPNPGFEILANGEEPTDVSDLDHAASWEQATEATSDYYSTVNNSFPDRMHMGETLQMPEQINPESNRWVGGWQNTVYEDTDPEDYIEYIGTELLSPLVQGETYTFKMKIGAPKTESNQLPDRLIGDLVVLGLPDNTNFPISGEDCKQDAYEEIGRVSIDILAFSWEEVTINIVPQLQDYEFIMFGLACDTEQNRDFVYFLADDLLLIQGEDPCPSACYSITGDSPPCNDQTDDSQSTYTYNFTLTNNLEEESFDKILLFDDDQNFDLDAGGTLIQLPTMLAPGDSVDLTWEINANNYVADTAMYCFEIAPYNHSGPCCKEEHCVELMSCCTEQPGQTKNLIDSADGCCYSYGFENCIPDYFISVVFEMQTDDLSLEGLAVSDGFQLSQTSTRLTLSMLDGSFIPEGSIDNALSFCIEGMTSNSPEIQEMNITWTALVGGEFNNLETELCILECPVPPDQCAELIEPELYCDEDGIYHYQFRIKNVNEQMLDASIVVLGPEGNTVPGDFSEQTFPDFPDHSPGGNPYLEYNDTTDLIDIILPNADLGDSYQYIISLHDYRNINAEEGDYWCCFTPDTLVINVDDPCISTFSDSSNALEYVIYPNPSSEAFIIRFEEALISRSTLIITDINGNIIVTKNLTEKTYKEKIEGLDLLDGVYYLSVYNDEGQSYHQRFFKN